MRGLPDEPRLRYCDQFLDVLVMGNGLWFLMAFFVGECLMYGLTSLTDDGRVLAAIGMASVILSTFVSSQTGWPALPFQIVAGVKARMLAPYPASSITLQHALTSTS